MASSVLFQLPSQQRALVIAEKGQVETTSKTLPIVGDDNILVNVKAIALNPTDWKHVDAGMLDPGDSIGCDFAGDVVCVGKNVGAVHFKLGDAVAGFVRGGFIEPTNGAFQEFVRTLPQLVWKLPPGMAYQEAAPMGGIALSTAAQALFFRLNLPKPWETAGKSTPIVIWSGSTGVGMYAIRLAKLANLRVATVASEKNHALVKRLGADIVFDYRDPKAASTIRAWGENRIEHVLDTISEGGSTENAAACLGEQGGKVITLLPGNRTMAGGQNWPSNVSINYISIYSVLNPSNKQDFEDIFRWNAYLSTNPELVSELKAVPINEWEKTGLEVIPDALDFVRSGKHSGEKVVVKL